MGTTNPPQTIPKPSPVKARHHALPAIAEFSIDLAKLVEDPATTDDNGVYSFPGTTASLPGPSTIDPGIITHHHPTIPLAHVH